MEALDEIKEGFRADIFESSVGSSKPFKYGLAYCMG